MVAFCDYEPDPPIIKRMILKRETTIDVYHFIILFMVAIFFLTI